MRALTPTQETHFADPIIERGSIGRYVAIGMTGMALDALLFVLFIHLGIAPVLATLLSTLTGIINNYVLNSKFNFHMALNVTSGLRFIIVGFLGLLLSVIVLQLLLGAGVSAIGAKAVSIPAVVVSQFLANKYWSFRPRA